MPDNRILRGVTKPIQNGNVSVKDVVFSKKKPLFILFSFSGEHGASDFLASAKYKQERLKRKYPLAEIRIVEGFKLIDEFKKEWVKLYNELDAESIYQLWEVHYFGHGNQDCLLLDDKGVNLHFVKNDELPILPWHPNRGIFVLHSCRGAAYEDYFSKDNMESKICLAQRISNLQQTRCLGQVVYANFCALPSKYIFAMMNTPSINQVILTEEEKEAEMRYRSEPITNNVAIFMGADKSLWGYALLTGATGKKILKNKQQYENAMASLEKVIYPKYQIYYDVEILSSRNQIMPCRVFNKGVLEQEHIVELDKFNNNDLDFI
ncbi:hypothetical protein RHO12_09950 [Orbus sturtevantii]|uniref:hypothetical protein n=1 Tax=Orbus sturtevantii TaxID=3074109 RepID=UPI00370D9E91